MTLEKSNIEIKRSSEKSFGFVFSVVFLIIGLYPLVSTGGIAWWAIIISAILIVTTFVYPSVFRWPNLLWFKFGLLLGAIIAPIVMFLVYITTVTPIGLGMKLFRKDPLRLKLDSNIDSYWIVRSSPIQSMKNQF